MRYLAFILIPVSIFYSCTAPEKEEEGQIMEYAGDEDSEALDESVEDAEEEDEFSITYTQVLETYIGIYQDLAIMILKQEKGTNDDGTVNVTGYYFYEKHQKNLDLEGVMDPISGKYVLTESYKGKTTGYMEFIPGIADESFWTPANNTSDEQELNAKLLTGGDPLEMTLELNHGQYKYKHNVMMMVDEDENFEATDELNVTFINDEYMAFYINVTRTNAHLGSVAGVAKVYGDHARYLVDEGDEYMLCDLEFDLSEAGEIKVIENDCSSWHGAYASFDGTYKK